MQLHLLKGLMNESDESLAEREHARSGVLVNDEIERLIRDGAPVAVGVSGGSDSQAAALATFAYLDDVRHAGPRVLVHSDLGSVEWNDSLRVCEELAQHLGAELIRVQRAAGGLMERWHSRWESSKKRYRELSTVTLVLPWSGASLRFCTSELKTTIIGAELRRRFRGQSVLNVTGVRRDESPARARQSIAEHDKNGSTLATQLWTWRPIAHWTKPRTFESARSAGLRVHPAYTDHGLSRVSCRFCVLASQRDLSAAAATDEARELLLEIVSLEMASTFGFQGGRWLADVAAKHLPEDLLARVAQAQERAKVRQAAERAIPKELLYQQGWPVRMPTQAEAELLADVRQQVATAVDVEIECSTASSVMSRFAELLAAKAARERSRRMPVAA